VDTWTLPRTVTRLGAVDACAAKDEVESTAAVYVIAAQTHEHNPSRSIVHPHGCQTLRI